MLRSRWYPSATGVGLPEGEGINVGQRAQVDDRVLEVVARGDARDAAGATNGGDRCWFECGDYYFSCRNRDEFARICQDIFRDHEYVFQTRRWAPLIIDAGAHVGGATHYFKRRYPRARVLAIEANPTTFRLLEKNIRRNGL